MSTTLWPRDEQTEGKHLILKHYLDGWFPILGRWNGRLLFIDGFAGPGEYENGEPGSPLVALECVEQHKREERLRGVEIACLFMESDKRRARHLEHVLGHHTLPPDTSCHVLPGKFDDHMADILDYLAEQEARLAPAFVMIDPFGVKGSPMSLIKRILQNPRSECMISFMYEPIRRFHEQSEFKPHLNQLFGTTEWERCLEMEESDSKKRFLHQLFSKQLKLHGASYVISFELWRGNRHIYTIYFTTNSLKGCDLMKKAIWKVEPSGSYAFQGHAGQLRLRFEANTEPLVKQLRRKFGNRWTRVERIEEFVTGDETIFHKGHLRRRTLQPLERAGRITVLRPGRTRGFSSGKGIKVRFH